MTIASPAPLDFVRAFPHVSGSSRRIKAAPTVLTPTAAAMMAASGAFRTKNEEPAFRLWRFAAAAFLVLSAATLAVAADHRPLGESAKVNHLLLAQSDALSSLGVGDYAGDLADLAPAAAPAPLDPQDRFEVERMFRLSGAR
jgi:hypothetical protein